MIDLVPDGSTHDEVVQLAQAIEAAGCDDPQHRNRLARGAYPDHRHQRAAQGFLPGSRKKLMGKVGIPVITSNRINTAGRGRRGAGGRLRRHGLDGAAVPCRFGLREEGDGG